MAQIRSLGRRSKTWQRMLAGMLTFGLLASAVTRAADWPAYRHDAQRSAVTDEKLTFPLPPTWTYTTGRAPCPAWPEPGRSMNLMDFDYAYQPVASGGLVFFGSSADDTVRAIDASSGKLAWSFTTGAPVRFAPQIADGKCYFVSDDGLAYCVDARTGKEAWRFRGGIDDRRFLAQNRLASRWLCRSGILIRDNVAYLTVGMWPSEGVFVFALDAASGRILWCNDTNSADYINYPHAPSSAFGGPAPQGYLLANANHLVMPTGRSAPATYDIKTGKLGFYEAEAANRGGTYAMLFGDTVFTSAIAWQPDQTPRLGQSTPHRVDSLAARSLTSGREEWSYTAAVKAITDELKGDHWRSQIGAGIFGRQRAIFADKKLYIMGCGRIDAVELTGGNKATKLWSLDAPRVYGEALAANALILGETGQVEALDPASGKQLWKAAVDGEARGVAISDGRVIVSTDKGTVYCFGAGTGNGAVVVESAKRLAAPETPALTTVLRQLPPAETLAGYAVIAGEADTQLGEAVAAATNLHVVCVLADGNAAQAARRRLAAENAIYGRRICIEAIDSKNANKLTLPPYFANVVIISGKAGGVEAAELYRILRPCGGVMCFTGGAAGGEIAKQAGVPAAEIKTAGADVTVVRGKLEGAFDWDSKAEADERVKWPLEFQWFGEPGQELVLARHAGPRTPIAANGRFFIFGEYYITAVDAYNGTKLWQRRFNRDTCSVSGKFTADDTSVYVTTDRNTAQYDAQTGQLVKVYGPETAGPPVREAKAGAKFTAQGKEGYDGEVSFDGSGDRLKMLLTAKSPAASVDDIWELSFDFRTPAERLKAPGAGTFDLVVNAWEGTQRAHATFAHPTVTTRRVNPEDKNTAVVELSIPWAELEKQVGWKPTNFAMDADIKLHKGEFNLQFWGRALVNGQRWFQDDAQAVVALEAAKPAGAGVVSAYLPAPLAPASALPAYATNQGREPLMVRHRNDGDTDPGYAEGLAAAGPDEKPLKRAAGYELASRNMPFTGETGTRDYTRSYGCSGTSTSAVMDFFRSGTIGMYDRQDDSGMRNIAGIKSGCGVTIVPALGMMLYGESTADCLCGYSFATSLGMAPVTARRNEDWALFNDKDLTAGMVRTAALNFGAPGDRRDEKGLLWLSFPRPGVAIKKNYTLPLPYAVELLPGFGPERINADRQPIANDADHGWIYGSQLKGVTHVQMDLIYHQPLKVLLSLDAGQAPKIDGELTDACWNGVGAVNPQGRGGNYYFRHDEKNLYIAYEATAARDVLGKRTAWKAEVKSRDGDIAKDDYMSVALAGPGGRKIATFGVSAGGAQWDSLLDFSAAVPPLAGATIDGKADEWKDGAAWRGATVQLPAKGQVHAAWSKEGLVLLAELPKGFSAGPEMTGLAILLGRAGGEGFQELTIDAATGKVQTGAWQGEKSVPAKIKTAAAPSADGVTVEALVPWESLGVKAEAGAAASLFLRCFAPGEKILATGNRMPWFETRERTNAFKRQRELGLRLVEQAASPVIATNARKDNAAYKFVDLVPVAKDNVAWNGQWTATAHTDRDNFRAEAAIPWETLAAAGIGREKLHVEVNRVPRTGGEQDNVAAQFERSAVEVVAMEVPTTPGKYTVRLHFAELDEVSPGQRVFDVVLQGKTVIKDLDVAKEAGGRLRALVKEFTGVVADKQIDVKFVPKSAAVDGKSAPILSGMEVLQQ